MSKQQSNEVKKKLVEDSKQTANKFHMLMDSVKEERDTSHVILVKQSDIIKRQ